MADKISGYPAKTTVNEGDLKDVSSFDGANYVSQKMTYSDEKDFLANEFHRQGGNAYGAALEIGTTDNNNVSIERNGVEKIGVSASEVEFADYINIGDGNDSANLRPLSYKVAQLSSTITILAIGTTSDFFIGIPIGRVQAYDVLIQGLDGYWYKEENTHIANSLYHTRLSDVTANDRIQIHVDAGSVNLLGGKVKIIIHYTA